MFCKILRRILLCVLLPSSVFSQSFESVLGGTGDERPTDLFRDLNGNYWITGFTESSSIHRDALVIKYDQDGNPLWLRSFFLPGVHRLNSLTVNQADGSAIMAGQGTDTYPSVASLHKIDSSGNLVWSRDYHTAWPSGGFNEVISDLEGNIYALGAYALWSSQYLMVMRTDTAGNPIWIEGLGSFGASEFFISAACTHDTGVVFATHGVAFPMFSNYGITRMDKHGNILWVTGTTSPSIYNFIQVDVLHDGNLVVMGNSDIDQDSILEIFLLEITASGSVLDMDLYETNAGNLSANALFIDSLGNYWIKGTLDDTTTHNMVLQLDSVRNVVMARSFTTSGFFSEIWYDNQGLVVAGSRRNSTIPSNFESDILLMRMAGMSHVCGDSSLTIYQTDTIFNLALPGPGVKDTAQFFTSSRNPIVYNPVFTEDIYCNSCGFNAAFSMNKPVFCVGDSIYAIADSSTIWQSLLWYWNGQPVSSANQLILPADSVGIFELMLIATSGGCADTLRRLIDISRVGPAAFAATSTGLSVNFTDSSAGSPVQWQWNFGDGNSSVIQHPQNTYSVSGIYQVCLTVENLAGCRETHCDTVQVLQSAREEEEIQGVAIYPNPATDFLRIRSGADHMSHAEIVSTDGKVLASFEIEAGEAEVNIADIPAGIYFLRLWAKGRWENHKLVIMR